MSTGATGRVVRITAPALPVVVALPPLDSLDAVALRILGNARNMDGTQLSAQVLARRPGGARETARQPAGHSEGNVMTAPNEAAIAAAREPLHVLADMREQLAPLVALASRVLEDTDGPDGATEAEVRAVGEGLQAFARTFAAGYNEVDYWQIAQYREAHGAGQ